jgi:uncharacterized protein (TIGR02594 family)
MTALPEQYAWLEREGAPRMLVEALKLYAVAEVKGAGDNPVILDWAKEIGLGADYKHDSVAWCGLAMAVIAKRAGKGPPHDPLWALNWRSFGKSVLAPMLGDVLVFTRPGGAHVTMYCGEDAEAYHCLGGNQADRVCIERIAKSRQHWARRPLYATQPLNVRVVHLAATGKLSEKED